MAKCKGCQLISCETVLLDKETGSKIEVGICKGFHIIVRLDEGHEKCTCDRGV